MIRQHGVALITVMLIVAIATVVSVNMASRQQIDIRRTANTFFFQQGMIHLPALELWASRTLGEDGKDNQYDHYGETWATPLPPTPIAGGIAAGEIRDLNGRFNLNTLVDDDGQQVSERIAQLRRLLANLQLDPELASAITDWVDSDIEATPPYGAEDAHYQNSDPPYLAANQPMLSVSELLLVNGIDQEIFDTLRPHVAAIERTAPFNINTTSAEVLASLHPEIPLGQASSTVQQLIDAPLTSNQSAQELPLFAGLTLPDISLGVSSQHFVIMSSLQMDKLQLSHYTLLRRDGNNHLTVIRRSTTPL